MRSGATRTSSLKTQARPRSERTAHPSAAFAAGYAVLFLSIVLGPYRRGDAWSWWALLAAALTLGILIAARVPALGTRAGAGTGLVQLAVVIVALLLDVRRLRAARA